MQELPAPSEPRPVRTPSHPWLDRRRSGFAPPVAVKEGFQIGQIRVSGSQATSQFFKNHMESLRRNPSKSHFAAKGLDLEPNFSGGASNHLMREIVTPCGDWTEEEPTPPLPHCSTRTHFSRRRGIPSAWRGAQQDTMSDTVRSSFDRRFQGGRSSARVHVFTSYEGNKGHGYDRSNERTDSMSLPSSCGPRPKRTTLSTCVFYIF